MKKIKYKVLLLGLILFFVNMFIIIEKFLYLMSNNISHRVVADINDTFFGYIFFIITFFISIALISYSLLFNNKLSKLGKYIIDLYLKRYGRKDK